MGGYFTHKQIFYINSRDRLTGDDSDFTIKLDIDTNTGYDRVVLLDCSIPRSFYHIQDGYNTFYINEGGSDLLITLPAGNYTRTSLKSVLQDLLNSVGSFTYAITYRNINSSYDDGKWVYSVSGNSGVQPSFIFGNDFYEILGFAKNTTYNFSADTLTCPNCININFESTLFINSDIVQNKTDNILDDIITTNDSSFSYITYINPTPQEFSKTFNGKNNNVFRFTLTDEDGKKIHLNGLNYLMVIMVYKSNRIFDIIKGFIKMKTLEK